MIGHVTVKKGGFPQKSQTLILPLFTADLKTNKILKQIDQKSSGELSEKIKTHEFEGKEGQSVSAENISGYKAVLLLGVGEKKEFSLIQLREGVAKALRAVRMMKFTTVDLFLPEVELSFQLGKHLALAVHLSNYSFLKYKSKEAKKKHTVITEANLILSQPAKEKDVLLMQEGIRIAATIDLGISLARDLVNEPAIHLGPDEMVATARSIEKESKGLLKVKVLEEAECRRLGMGAFLGVAQGSDKKPRFIVIQTVSKKAGKKKYVSVVGKSIMFDSGGLSLKPGSSMEDMKMDMAGAASVLGVFKTLVQAPDFLRRIADQMELSGVIPACENMPSGKAMRPGDIVTALNGKTIEVLNTDAEGRLALADAVSYAEKYLKAEYIIDLATLTGACMVALGNDLAGAFGNDKELIKLVVDTANHEGEGIWELPLYKKYLKQMKSEIADLKNIGGGRMGGAITAALFLSEFVKKAKWVHLDIAGPAFRHEPPQGTLPHGASGWGVMTVLGVITQLINV